ncbi:MAG: hypothetical protein E7246_06085 [Lachnoclostridium sp.]|nr:hypothetical protein [Lachnoclostridium sp.]
MSGEKRKRGELLTEDEQLEIREDISELKLRTQEYEVVDGLLLEIEDELKSKKKLMEIKKLLSAAQEQVEKAEGLLKEVIQEREHEDRAIEDAILLSDGVREVKEQEEETED